MSTDMKPKHGPPESVLPAQQITEDVLLEKYAKDSDACADDIHSRVAHALAGNEECPQQFYRRFYDAQIDGFLPAGRILSAAGTDLQSTLINCFVQPVGDSIGNTQALSSEELQRLIDLLRSNPDATVEENESVETLERLQRLRNASGLPPGIFSALLESAETMRRGGGVGYDFSAIRPHGAKVNGTGSEASGPVSYMHVFDRMCTTVSSAGSRRGAQMGVLRIDHPDVERFIHAKSVEGALTQFNVSVAVTNDFLEALRGGSKYDLVHEAEPSEALKAAGAYQRSDGKWVYRSIDPQAFWDKIMLNTYDYAEPGILFVDNANKDNNLWYAETFDATNPCAEQWLPPYGCCCLGSINLTKFVTSPFSELAEFDLAAFVKLVRTAVRMLDNVLDITYWPLDQQRAEAMSKRRIGLGFTGLGDALLMLGLRYDSPEGRRMAAHISEFMSYAAYEASVDLAIEKEPFPLFDAGRYLQSGFTKRLPPELRSRIRKHGIRNSHLLSIAPTGTISLAFADNASNGIEPAYSWFYERKKRTSNDDTKSYFVVDHAFREYCVKEYGIDPSRISDATRSELSETVQREVDDWLAWQSAVPEADFFAYYRSGSEHFFGDVRIHHESPGEGWKVGIPERLDPKMTREEAVGLVQGVLDRGALDNLAARLPEHFVSALDISAQAHLDMVAAVQPFIDSSISKTVNVPADYPYESFKDLYHQAAKANLKGLATYRPSDVRGSVLSVGTNDKSPGVELNQSDIDRRLRIDALPEPVMKSLRWPKRPNLPAGNPSWTYMVNTGREKFAVFVGYTENGTNHPFEVWVNGAEQPRGLGAIAKALSMDMRSNDRSFLLAKLDSLEKAVGDDGFDLELPPDGNLITVPSLVSGFAKLIKHSINELGGVLPEISEGEKGATELIGHSMTPMMDALMSAREPKTGPDGTMAWAVDVKNVATGDDFVMFVKELTMPDGQQRPFSVWMAGEYPRVFDGLCKVLSYDMRILDPAWIGEKLRTLIDYLEPLGDFLARVPGSTKQANFPSTVAYVTRLLIRRYAMLGILDEEGFPVSEAGLMDSDYQDNVVRLRVNRAERSNKKQCHECGAVAMIRKENCDWCEACGATGSCA